MAQANPTRRRSTGRRGRRGKAGPLPDRIYAQASPRSVGGTSLFETSAPVTAGEVAAFSSEEGVVQDAARRLRDAGFDVLQVAPTTINIAGPAERYEQVFGTSLVTEERDVVKAFGRHDTATHIDTTDTDLPGLIDTSGTPLGDVLEGVAISEPVYFHAEEPFAPTKGYWHLRLPGDVSGALNADRAHRRRVTGKGVHLVMTDSGWYRHRYFTRRGYRTNPVALGPGTSDPEVDANGHGTGESANALAVAPDAEFTMVKLNFVNPTASFNAAVALSPDIISNSWGWSTNGPLSAIQQAMAAAVATAVANGVVVVFSAGNGGFGFPGQHPDVISAGGVYMGPDGALRATEYASGFASQVYAGRKVPDVSGLVGDPPRAAYLMLPIPSGCEIDVDLGGTPHPAGDGTTDTDGWAAFSGTSAAAPQVAGACALIRQVCPGLAPAKVRRILRQTARDVTAGTNAMGEVAGPGYDLATGSGLVNANKAALRATLQRLSDAAEAQDDPDALSAQDADELARLLAVADGSD